MSSFRTVKRKGCQKPKISREKRIKRNWIPERMSTEKMPPDREVAPKGLSREGDVKEVKANNGFGNVVSF